jgi:uncharacterized membrane protein
MLYWFMNSEEKERMEVELNRLSAQLHQQQETIRKMQDLLRGHQEPVKPSLPTHRPFMQQWSLENFIGLRLIHFIGIVVLVIGLSIGVKYAINKDLISEGMRIFLAYAAGFILLILSFRLKEKYTLFSAILFSGAMASLYFTTYAAYVYYAMMPFVLAFVLMILMTVYTVFEAIRYARQEIALLGLVGAYGIPFLISQNNDRPELFFLYISMINLGVVYLCIRKQWKRVGRAAQTITWILFLGWASLSQREGWPPTGFVFLVFFFLLFLFTIVAPKKLESRMFSINDTYQLVLNNLAFYLGSLFVFGWITDTDIAMVSLFLSIFTALQALAFHYYLKEEMILVRMLATLALMLFIVFIGFQWTGFVVTLLWLLTAVLVFAWGFMMRSVQARLGAIILIGLTLAKLLLLDSLTFSSLQKVIAYLVLGILLLVVSFFYQKFRKQIFGE